MKSAPTKLDLAMMEKGWIPVTLAAEKMKLDPSTVYRLADEGILECVKANHRRYVSVKSCRAHLGEVAAKVLGL